MRRRLLVLVAVLAVVAMVSLTAVGTSSTMVAVKVVAALDRPAPSWTVIARLSATLLPAAVCGALMA